MTCASAARINRIASTARTAPARGTAPKTGPETAADERERCRGRGRAPDQAVRRAGRGGRPDRRGAGRPARRRARAERSGQDHRPGNARGFRRPHQRHGPRPWRRPPPWRPGLARPDRAGAAVHQPGSRAHGARDPGPVRATLPGAAAGRGGDEPGRPHRRRADPGRGAVRRPAPPGRPGHRHHRAARGAVPGRAHHRPGPRGSPAQLARGAGPHGRRHHGHPHHPLHRRGWLPRGPAASHQRRPPAGRHHPGAAAGPGRPTRRPLPAARSGPDRGPSPRAGQPLRPRRSRPDHPQRRPGRRAAGPAGLGRPEVPRPVRDRGRPAQPRGRLPDRDRRTAREQLMTDTAMRRLPSAGTLLLAQIRYQAKLLAGGRAVVIGVGLPVILLIASSTRQAHPGAADIAGYACFGLTLTAWNTYGVRLVAAREAGVLKRWRATPLPRWCYFLGRIVACVIVAAIAGVATVLAAVLLYHTHLSSSAWLGALAAFVLGGAAWAATATALSAAIPTTEA